MATKSKTTFGSTIKSILSSKAGTISSKRLMGIFMVLVASGILITNVAINGITSEMTGIMDTYIISAVSLLGVDSVTNIWKGKKETTTENEEEILN